MQTAVKTQPVMTAYHPTAFRAAPLRRFIFQKQSDAMRFYKIEIFNHAHMVFSTIPFIKVFEPATGEIVTLIAETDKSFSHQVALLCHEGTVLTTWQATGTVFFGEPLILKVVFHRQVADAEAAIHSTGGDQIFFHQSSLKR